MKRAAMFIAVAILVLPVGLLAGVEVKPYGFVLVNASYNTRSVTDIPVNAAAIGGGEPNFVITPRQTRFGLKMKSDAGYSPGGVIEVDFWGLRGSGPNGGPTQSAVRLRRAFAELHMNKVDLLVGQEWILFSPLNPTTIMHVSLPGMMSSGNLWARLPQVRATLKPAEGIVLQGALLRPLGANANMIPVAQGDVFGAGERFGWPWAQGRIAYTTPGETKVTIGGGVHFGMEDFGDDPAGDDITATSMAVGGDLSVKLEKVTISGEGYFGQNIRTLFSNAHLEAVTDTMRVDGALVPYQGIEEIKAFGGWGEVKFAASPKMDVAINAGVESMDDEFLGDGDIKTNTTIMANAILKATEGFQVGLEVGFINTERIQDDPATQDKETDDGTSNLNVNLSFMFNF